MMNASFLPGELDGGTAGKRCGQKLHRNNQREAIPEGESSKRYAETPVGSLPTGVSFVPFCPFPGLSAFPVWVSKWVKAKTVLRSLPRMGQKWVCPIGWPIFFPFDQELRRSRQRLRSPIRILKLLRDKNSENKGVSRTTSVFISAIRPAGPSGRCGRR